MMFILPTEAPDLDYSNAAATIVVSTSDRARERAERALEASGLRLGASLPVEQAAAHLDLQGSAAAVWVEIDTDCGRLLDQLLGVIGRDVAAGRYPAVVSTCAAVLDPVAAALGQADVELIVDADDGARVAALALALAKRDIPLSVADVASDRSAERLRQLSDEVSRIASTLARLSTGPGSPVAEAAPRVRPEDLPPLSAETVRDVIRARRLRSQFFDDELFADPAWDMMLDLLQAEIAQLRVPVSSLCIAAAVPATTALRWLKRMVEKGLFVRQADRHDGRRVFVELAAPTSEALRRYFAEARAQAVI